MNLFGNSKGAAARERQLDELLAAVLQAQHVARAQCNADDGDREAKQLFGRLEAVRVEVEQLRRGEGPAPFEEIDPKWTGPLPWQLVPEC